MLISIVAAPVFISTTSDFQIPFSTSTPRVVIYFLHLSLCDWDTLRFQSSFNLHFSDVYGCLIFKNNVLAICILSFENSVQFCIPILSNLFSWCLNLSVSQISLYILDTDCQSGGSCKETIPLYRLPLPSSDVVLYCTEIFQFHEVSVVNCVFSCLLYLGPVQKVLSCVYKCSESVFTKHKRRLVHMNFQQE